MIFFLFWSEIHVITLMNNLGSDRQPKDLLDLSGHGVQ